MKKMVLLMILCIFISGCGSKSISEESKTLTEYIKNHSSEKLGCAGCNEMYFYEEDPKCDALDENILYFGNGYLILSDGSVYVTNFDNDKLYSNNQKCKLVDSEVKVRNVVDGYFIGADNKMYKLNKEDKDYFLEERETYYYNDFYVDEDVIQVERDYWTNDAKVLKADGNIYIRKYNSRTLESEEVLLSNQEYGNIKMFEYDTSSMSNQIINMLLTDKGFYVSTITNEEECNTYEDVECKYELTPGGVYHKYKDDIKYIGPQYTILKDNNIIVTSYLGAKLDK